MKLTPTQRRNFISSWLFYKKPKPQTVTVEEFKPSKYLEMNHEIWKTCNSCGEHFDLRKELKMICPCCGSVDLSNG